MARSVKLTQQRIYIIPNKSGLLFLLLVSLLFVNGVNYQNNLIFSFSVLLLSIFITGIVVSYQNMAGLVISAGHGEAVFSADTTRLHLAIEHGSKKSKDGLRLGFERSTSQLLPPLSSKRPLTLNFKSGARGYLSVPRITLYSVYPLGLFTCWTWIRLDFDGVVYPRPCYVPYQYVGHSDAAMDAAQPLVHSGVDDFRGFRRYQAGDSLKHVAWRQFAKTNQLLTKEFEQPQAAGHWLDWQALAGYTNEQRLQILCGWVVRSHEENREYGLVLPGLKIALGRGDSQRQACLRALALHGLAVKSQVGRL